MKEYVQNFITESLQWLEKLESLCLEAEKEEDSGTQLSDIARILHTVKGSAGMFSFKNIEHVAHGLENIFNKTLTGEIGLSKEIIDICFEFTDFVRLSFSQNISDTEENSSKQKLLSKIEKFTDTKFSEAETDDSAKQSGIFYILLRPKSDFKERGVNLFNIINDIESFGNHVKYERVDEEAAKGDSEYFYMFWEFIINSEQAEENLKELFFFVEEETTIVKIAESELFFSESFQELLKSLDELPGPIDLSVFSKENIIKNENTKKNEFSEQKPENTTLSEISDYITIDAAKTDELMNLVSEMVTLKESLAGEAERINDKKLNSISEKLERLTRRIQDNALSIRLIPLSKIMVKFEKQIRDLAASFGKEVVFEKYGIETQLDKTIVDQLSEPLIHIFRNAVDHGIETPDEREKNGKSRKGTIKLIAAGNGSYVSIQIHDDGRGIDPQKIRQIAVKKGFINETDILTETEMLNLIFLPGFSTAENLSKVSGRGVGMDVIKQKINDLRGETEINSEKGLGTYITLRLPLTLSIVDTLTVEIDQRRFLVSKDAVQRAIEITQEEEKSIRNQLFLLENEWIPVLKMNEKFGKGSEELRFRNILIVQYKSKNYGIIVDKIIGEYQAVIKPLGTLFSSEDGFSGAGILGDGTPVLMIDIGKTIKKHLK